eukprot:816803-Pleurochrysis_carterae.AAC.1
MAGSLAACEAVYLRGSLTELGFPPPSPTELRMDNSGAINLAHDPVCNAKAKHIDRRELKIRELVADGTICRTVGQQQVLVAYGSTPQHGTSRPVNSLQNFYLLVMLGLDPGTSRLRNERSTH